MTTEQPSFEERVRLISQAADIIVAEAERMAAVAKRFAEQRATRPAGNWKRAKVYKSREQADATAS